MALERFKRTARIDTGSPDMTAASAAQRRSATFGAFADQMHDRRDREVATEQEQAGRTAGAEDPLTPKREGGTIADDAYNRGLLVTQAASLANDAKAALQRFHMEHPDDIEGFQTQVQGYRRGISSQLDRDSAALFDMELEHLSNPMVLDIEKTVRAQNRAQGRAETLQLFENTVDEALRASREGDAERGTDGLLRLEVELAAALASDFITEPEALQIREQARVGSDREMMLGAFERTLQSEGLDAADARLQEFKNSRPDGLSPDEHRKLTGEMRALWSQEASRQTRLASLANAKNAAVESAYKEQVKDALFVLKRGRVPPGIDSLVQAVGGTELGDQLEAGLVMAHKLEVYSAQRPEDRAQIRAAVASNQTMTREELEFLDAMDKRDAELRTLADKNGIAYGQEIGIVDELPPFDQTDPGPALAARVEAARAVEEHLGRRVSPLAPADEMAFSRMMNQPGVTPSDHAQMLGVLVQGLGPRYAMQALEAMTEEGRYYAGAGLAIAEGDPVAATTILEGLALRRDKDHPRVVPPDADLVPDLGDLMALYAEDPDRRSQMVDAVRSAYAALSAREGDFSGIVDGSRVKEAVRAVTGGIMDTDWGLISAPRRGLDEDDFVRWVDRLKPEDLETMGGVAHYGNAKALELIQDEDVQLEEIRRGAWYVRRGINYLSRPDGEPFVLEWNR